MELAQPALDRVVVTMLAIPRAAWHGGLCETPVPGARRRQGGLAANRAAAAFRARAASRPAGPAVREPARIPEDGGQAGTL
jgi:hypothetical protein